MLMIDWKDGREGVLTYDTLDFIKEIMNLNHIQLVGVAFNFMCFKSAAPENDVFMINKFVSAVEKKWVTNLKLFLVVIQVCFHKQCIMI